MTENNIYKSLDGLITSLLLLISLFHLATSCEFPAAVQTNATLLQSGKARDWRGRVKAQFTESLLQIEIGPKKMRTKSTGSMMGQIEHTRACLRVLHGGKYLVAHEEPGQQVTKYSCVQFVMRSDDVVQIRSAPVEDKLTLALCNDDRLELDKWLMIDFAHVGRNPLACPMRGGYTIGMFDKIRARGVCDAWRGEVRLESECTSGEGMTFYFRSQKCVPEDVYMFSTQPIYCLANWAEGGYTFSLLKHNDLAYYWMLRLPTRALVASESFSAYLFKDLLADTNEYTEETLNYIRMDMSPDTTYDITKLCIDDYEICSRVKPPCTDHNAHLALICPITCGVCQAHSHTFCHLPSDWSGHWSDLGGGNAKKARPSGQAASASRRSVSVNTTTLTLHESAYEDESYRCIQWSSGRDYSSKMLVRTFERGCKPRYTCIKQVKRAPSLLYLRLSRTALWPLITNPSDPMDCTSFTYDLPHYGDPLTVDLSVTANSALMLLETARSSRLQSVICSSPAAQYSEYGATFGSTHNRHRRVNTADCHASLSISRSQTSFSFVSDGCETNSSLPAEETYDCLESSLLDVDSSARLVVTQTRSSPNRIFCWLFIKPTESTRFYLLNVTQCHMMLRSDANLNKLFHYVAVFSSRNRRIATTKSPEIPQNSGSHSGTYNRTNEVADRDRNRSPIGPSSGVTDKTNSVNLPSERVGLDSSDNDTDSNVLGTMEPPTTNPVVISSAVIILAILQTVVLCGCL